MGLGFESLRVYEYFHKEEDVSILAYPLLFVCHPYFLKDSRYLGLTHYFSIDFKSLYNWLSRKKVGKFLYFLSFSFLCIMEDTYLYHLASLVLPKDVLKYFSVVKIEPSPSLLRIHLDEKMEKELSYWAIILFLC